MKTTEELKLERSILIEYIDVKLESGDWHAVSDACNDIREIEAKILTMELMKNGTKAKSTLDET